MTHVQVFYDANAQREWERLERHRTEFAVTMRMVADHFPKPPARVLDVGGGPGRYSIDLARQGYHVSLQDLSPACVAFARAKAAEVGVSLESASPGNALDLSGLPPESFDAVLLMGPLYHLLAPEQRQRALREVHRVLRPGGVLGAAFITRYAPLRDVATYEPDWIVKNAAKVTELLGTGALHGEGGGFTDAYFAHPAEVRPLLEQCGYRFVDMVGCEGVLSLIETAVNQTTGATWEAWVDLNYRLGKDPTTQGTAEHLFAIARKGPSGS